MAPFGKFNCINYILFVIQTMIVPFILASGVYRGMHRFISSPRRCIVTYDLKKNNIIRQNYCEAL